jgi:hypothetical protein
LVAAPASVMAARQQWREGFWCGKFTYDRNPFELRCERAGSNTGNRGMPDRWASIYIAFSDPDQALPVNDPPSIRRAAEGRGRQALVALAEGDPLGRKG